MVELALFNYVNSLLSNDYFKVYNEKFEILKDCFNIYVINSRKKDGILLLLDEQDIIMNVSNDDEKIKKIIYRKIKVPFNYKRKKTKFFQISDKNFIIHFYKDISINDYKTAYSLCYVTDNKDIYFEKNILKDVAKKINQSMKVIQKYHNNNGISMDWLDFVDDGITAINQEGRIIYMNKACCEIIGLKKDEVLNKKLDSEDEEKSILFNVLKNKQKIIDFEYFPKHKEKTAHVINSAYPVFNDEGEAIGAIDIFRGIKRTRKLANTLAGSCATFHFENIITESVIMKKKIELAKRYALNEANIYIQGESGTGKELFAQSIHNYSKRCQQPFIAINCANLPYELVESELFGYDEGAFTGAKKGGKPGKFELANGGTLFLDELGEMPLHLQAKLLRVLETKTIYRVGGNKPINIVVKIITATNRDLYEMTKKGEFREDLYYRLKVLFIDIPPLRKRGKDVLMLADYFIKKASKSMNANIPKLDEEAKNLLLQYDWPGNIRQLENLIVRSLFTCEKNALTKQDLIKAGIHVKKQNFDCGNSLQSLAKEKLIEILRLTNGNKKKTGELLGVSRQTVYRLIKKYNIEV